MALPQYLDQMPPPVDMLADLKYPNSPFSALDDLNDRVEALELYYDDSPARAVYAVDVNNINVPVTVTLFTGVFPWNPKSVASNASTTITVNFPRAAVGDTVQCAFSPALPPTVLLNGVVSQQGVVQVALVNLSGKVLTIAPGTLRVTVLHHL